MLGERQGFQTKPLATESGSEMVERVYKLDVAAAHGDCCRLGILLIMSLAFMKCFGLMLLLEPDFDLLRYLPPSSPLRGFVEAMESQPQWSFGAALPLHVILPALNVLPLHLEGGRSRVKAFVDEILHIPEATVRTTHGASFCSN